MKALGVSNGRAGFTLVELLIVIVVIAILAGTTIVAYRGIQNRAYDTAVQNDLANFVKKMEAARLDNGEIYPYALTPGMGIRFTSGAYAIDSQGRNLRMCINPTDNTYVMYALSKSGNTFSVLNGQKPQQSAAAVGWAVCSRIGLSKTNPYPDGINDANANGAVDDSDWATWALH